MSLSLGLSVRFPPPPHTLDPGPAQAAHEDMEATCAHAIADRQAALKELGVLQKKAGRSASFFSRP